MNETDRAIRASGLRRTLPRSVVADVLCANPGHLTVSEIEEIIARAHPGAATIARSSIYRALEALEGAGLVAAIRSGQQEARFEWDGGHGHHHLICDDCGHVSEVRLDATLTLEQEAERVHGFRTRVRHLALRGTCTPCQGSAASEAAQGA